MSHHFKMLHISTSLIALCLLLLAFYTTNAVAADPELEFTKVSDRTGIVDLANAGDGSKRLFLVAQSGRVLIVQNDQTLSTPFLDIENRVMSGGERGLLSLAFPPDYQSTGYFYVWYTQAGGDTVLSRFSVSGNANVADENSETKILTVAQPFSNHNGGRLQFGPDGMLYLGLGDGGGAGDPQQNGQNGNTLLGKLIRIDVDPANGTYAVPADNPFVGDGNFMDEIWALGLRNPWKISFDGLTGDLYIADVGQGSREEVNYQPSGSNGGENYGWAIMEGTLCVENDCNQTGLTLPVTQYVNGQDCAITGGEVYRGDDYPNLFGVYLFGDFCSGRIWALRNEANNWISTMLVDTSYSISSFGRGEDGNVYVVDRDAGVYRISDVSEKPQPVVINTGFSDAWYNPDTDGQGILMTVFPGIDLMFVAWFTYETERPDENITAILGEPAHRWLTAIGPYSGNSVVLDIDRTEGGVFNKGLPEVEHNPDGTITIEFSSCNEGILTYDIESANLQGVIPIQRVIQNNVAICEAMQ